MAKQSGDGEASELRDELTRALGPDGWTVEVSVGAKYRYVIDLTHPLVPGAHGFSFNSPEAVLACLRDWREIQLVHDAPVRPDVRRLLGGLRGAAGVPHDEDAANAVRRVGYVLFEQGILTEDEARWLDRAVEPDPDRPTPTTP